MKKIMTSFLILLLLLTCFVPTAYAAPSSATLGEDYQTLTWEGHAYSRFNSPQALTQYETVEAEFLLSDSQKDTIKEVTLQTNPNQSIVHAHIAFKDGASFTAGFLRDDYKEKYEKAAAGQTENYIIDFEYPVGNTVTVSKSSLYGEPIVLSAEQLQSGNVFSVNVTLDEEILSVSLGALLICDDAYYFVAFADVGIESWYEFNEYEHEKLPAYKITDSKALTLLQEGKDAYFADDFGFLLDDNLGEKISVVFLILVFGIVPFIILVLFLIAAIRSKTGYKKLFRTIYLLAGFELIIAAIIAVLIKISL